jgi:predicted ATPase
MHLRKITIHPERFPVIDRYPFSLEILHHTPSIEFRRPVTLFAGENGAGKSTVLKAIARAAGIHIWGETEHSRVEHNRYEEALHQALGLEWADGPVPGSFFASQSFRNYAVLLDEWATADPRQLDRFNGKSPLAVSHGQSLMSYFRSRYGIRGIYFLDEPETALSPRSQLELLDLLDHMGRAGHAQFLVASHSPLLLACPGAEIHSFDSAPIRPIAYEDTEHYRVYKRFLAER